MTARYALYYAPRKESPLWEKASAWLGRDAYSGASCNPPEFSGLGEVDLGALTQDPRGYGFHATLKAPFELRAGRTEAELVDFTRTFAGLRPSFSADIGPSRLGHFHAFLLMAPSAEIEALHAACVREFDEFRAPLSEFDLARRRKSGLTPRQDELLVDWGYPYVFEEFRFHMTLTGPVRDKDLSLRLSERLSQYFVDETGPHDFDGVALFKQSERGAPFLILERAAFV